VAFHTYDNTFLIGNKLVMLTRPVPIRHLRWLRVLLPRLREVIPTLIATLQAEEPEFIEVARMKAELSDPLIYFSPEHAYGEWAFSVERPSYGYPYGSTITFSRFTVRDAFTGD
jgi:hypothetical protein